MIEYELVSPSDADSWRAYHDIRRRVLFEARGHIGVYEENHPDEMRPGNHPKLLLYRRDPLAVIRIDIAGVNAILRRVAVRADVQRRGHGRVLLSLAQRFALGIGCTEVSSYVAPDAVEFYRKCAFSVAGDRPMRPSGQDPVLMNKRL